MAVCRAHTGEGRGAPATRVGLLWKVIASIKREQARLDNEGHDVLRKLSPVDTAASGPDALPTARGLEGRPGVLLTPGKDVSKETPRGAAGVRGPCSGAPSLRTGCHAAGKAELKDRRVRSTFCHERRAPANTTALHWKGSVLSEQGENRGLNAEGRGQCR